MLTNALERPQKGAEATGPQVLPRGSPKSIYTLQGADSLSDLSNTTANLFPLNAVLFHLIVLEMQSQGGEQLLVFTDMSNILANFDNSAVTGVVNGICQLGLAKVRRYFGLDVAVKVFCSDEMNI